MATQKQEPARHTTAADTTAAVDAFMLQLDHPCKAGIEAIRRVILGAAPGISEGIKWQAPSYRTHEYFATTHLREKNGVGVILHLGAKVKSLGPGGLDIADPDGLLKWLAADRASVRFADAGEVHAREAAFAALIRCCIRYVQGLLPALPDRKGKTHGCATILREPACLSYLAAGECRQRH